MTGILGIAIIDKSQYSKFMVNPYHDYLTNQEAWTMRTSQKNIDSLTSAYGFNYKTLVEGKFKLNIHNAVTVNNRLFIYLGCDKLNALDHWYSASDKNNKRIDLFVKLA